MKPGLKQNGRPVALVLLGLGLLWSYWPTFVELSDRWAHDPQYSHGYLVPLFSLYLLWRQRQRLAASPFPGSGWGFGLVLAGLGLHLVGGYFYFPALDAVSLLPVLTGLCVVLGGWPALRCSWPALAFLAFMLPLPHSLKTALAQPLQQVAALASTYLLETFGLPAICRGNIIHINDTKIGVVEACNGLSMLITFFALSTAVAILTTRGWIYRTAALVSAVPIALIANILRITTTAVLMETVSGKAAHVFFHDVAGWLMMPIGLGLLGLEMLLLRWLIIEEDPESSDRRPALGFRLSAVGPRQSTVGQKGRVRPTAGR
jgi:exosortase